MIHTTFAKTNDIDDIIHILNENLLRSKCDIPRKDIESNGFLIHSFSQEEIQQSILYENTHIVLVAKVQEAIIGYSIGYELLHQRPSWFERIESTSPIIETLSFQKGLHLRHIAKKVDSIRSDHP